MIPTELQIDIQKMDAAAAELQRITERTEFALSVVTQAIRTQEAIAKGKVLKQLRDEIPDGEWMKFLNREDVSINHGTALGYINAAQLVEDAGPLYGEDMLMNIGSTTLDLIHKLPTNEKLEVLDQTQETGKPPTQRQLQKLQSKTSTKLSKNAEKLIEAKERKESATNSVDRKHANADVKRLELRILQLESDLEKEQSQKTEISDSLTEKEDDLHTATRKLEEAQADLAKALEESHSLRFDADTARQQRVSRVGNQLILTVPQLLADLQKYVAEYDYFSENVQIAVGDQLKTLMAYLDEHFKHQTDEETESASGSER